jgi:hypothetical protein
MIIDWHSELIKGNRLISAMLSEGRRYKDTATGDCKQSGISFLGITRPKLHGKKWEKFRGGSYLQPYLYF